MTIISSHVYSWSPTVARKESVSLMHSWPDVFWGFLCLPLKHQELATPGDKT